MALRKSAVLTTSCMDTSSASTTICTRGPHAHHGLTLDAKAHLAAKILVQSFDTKARLAAKRISSERFRSSYALGIDVSTSCSSPAMSLHVHALAAPSATNFRNKASTLPLAIQRRSSGVSG